MPEPEPSSPEKVNWAVATLTRVAGWVEIVVSGAVASTVKSRVAVAWLPAASVARTRKVWEPSASGLPGVSEPASEQEPKLGVPLSIEHSKEAPGSELKAKVGVASLVRPAGPESIPTAGGVRSTVQVKEAGL